VTHEDKSTPELLEELIQQHRTQLHQERVRSAGLQEANTALSAQNTELQAKVTQLEARIKGLAYEMIPRDEWATQRKALEGWVQQERDRGQAIIHAAANGLRRLDWGMYLKDGKPDVAAIAADAPKKRAAPAAPAPAPAPAVEPPLPPQEAAPSGLLEE
jgi:hypothetical protein